MEMDESGWKWMRWIKMDDKYDEDDEDYEDYEDDEKMKMLSCDKSYLLQKPQEV